MASQELVKEGTAVGLVQSRDWLQCFEQSGQLGNHSESGYESETCGSTPEADLRSSVWLAGFLHKHTDPGSHIQKVNNH